MLREAVLPISDKSVERRNVDRTILLLKSLSYFWRGAEQLEIRIIVPDDELDSIRDRLGSHYGDSLSITYKTETEVSPNISKIDSKFGYAKQMLIKLAESKSNKFDNYLVLDSDCVACKPFDENTFFVDGRIVTQWAPPSLGEWWIESASILGFELGQGFSNGDKIHVTPQILNKEICEGLKGYLSIARFLGVNWIDGLMKRYTGNHPHIWTEYTLYYLYAARTGRLEKLYVPPTEIPPERALHCASQNIWSAANYPNWSPERALSGDPGHFMVLQSISAHDVNFDVLAERWNQAAREMYPDYPV
jgi:hypothetical protein